MSKLREKKYNFPKDIQQVSEEDSIGIQSLAIESVFLTTKLCRQTSVCTAQSCRFSLYIGIVPSETLFWYACVSVNTALCKRKTICIA